MSDACKFYDPDQISINFAGIPVESGLADTTFLTVTRNVEAFKTKVSADGQVTRVKVKDKTGRVTITLMQRSDVNAAFSALHTLDKETPNGAGVGPLLIKDRQGTSLYTASKAWIEKDPDANFGTDSDVRAWVIFCADLVALTGGN